MKSRFLGARVVGLVAIAGLSVACNREPFFQAPGPFLSPSEASITIASTAAALPLNGSEELHVQVIAAPGKPAPRGTLVLFMTTLGSIEPSRAETDGDGRATVRFHAGSTSGVASIIAFSLGISLPVDEAIQIAIGAAAVGRVMVSATPGTVPSSGGTVKVVASVVDLGGNPLGGIPVAFSTTAGSLSQTVVTTGGNGSAETSLTTRQQATVTATAGAPGNGASQSTGTVTINVNQAASITVGAPSPTTAIVGQSVTFPITYGAGASFVRVTVDFGDGIILTFAGMPSAVSHAYSQPGSFVARVTGLDALGETQSGSSSSGVTVTNRPQPSVTIGLAPGSPAPVRATPVTFTITATPPGGTSTTIASIVVNFGDGVSVSLAGNSSSVSHVYPTAGTFVVTATATDSEGASGSGSTVIVVSP